MRDRGDRTSWASAYPMAQNNPPSTSYPESSVVPTCHPPTSSTHLLPTPSPHTLGSSSQYHQHHQHRLLGASSLSVPSLSSFRGASFVPLERAGAQSRMQQQQPPHQRPQPQHQQEHLSRQLAPLPPSFTMMSETWFGLVQTPRDAYLLLEACRLGMLYRITRRLTDLERSQIIRPGAVFVWEEKEAGIKRWTDHVRWSPSRVSGAFLIYSELLSASSRDSHPHPSDPLLKQSFSSTTLDGDRLHLIAYYSKAALDSGHLPTPTEDDRLRSIVVPPGVYPDHRATGGVEDQSSRDRQRTNLIPRTSVTSLENVPSVMSSHSMESTSSSLDTPQLHPATPTHLNEISYHRPSNSGPSQPPLSRRESCHKTASESKYPSQSSYFGGSLYPIGQNVMDNQALQTENSRWDSFQHSLSDWNSNGGVRSGTSAAPHDPVSYPNSSTPTTVSLTSPCGPTLPSLGTVQAENDRGQANEHRFPASVTQEPSSNASLLGFSGTHSYHPYVRPSNRDRVAKDRRMDGKPPRESRGLSLEPPASPGTPLNRTFTLPSIHNNCSDENPSDHGSMAPPSSKTKSPPQLISRSPELS